MYKLFHNNRCSKSRSCLKILNDHNIKFEVIEYLKITLTRKIVHEIIYNTLNPMEEVIRKNEKPFIHSNISYNNKADIISLLVKNPICLERPIFYNENNFIICRPPEIVLKYIK